MEGQSILNRREMSVGEDLCQAGDRNGALAYSIPPKTAKNPKTEVFAGFIAGSPPGFSGYTPGFSGLVARFYEGVFLQKVGLLGRKMADLGRFLMRPAFDGVVDSRAS